MLNTATLYDLDILSLPNRPKTSLWGNLDYCCTEGGKEQLKRILLLKEHSLENTLARQQAVAYIISKSKDIVFPIKENEVFYLTHYMDCNYSIDGTNTKVMLVLKSYAKLVGAKGDYLYILSAVKQTLLLISKIKSVYETIYSRTAPPLLKGIFSIIENSLAQLQIKDVDTILDSEPSPLLLYATDRQLRVQAKVALQNLLQAYYQLEALCSLAKAHVDMKLTFPQIGKGLAIIGLEHPLVKNCIPNNVTLSGEHMLLVTGPNMAGKSTFLKSIGLAFVMAYAGIGIAATYAQMPFLNQIITSINNEDDIGNGYSYFYNEVLKVKSMATSLNEDGATLIIADELFKGTNVKDANDCSETVINGLLKHNRGMFILATHLVETVQQYTGNNHCRLLCFEGSIQPESPICFDYQLKEGVSTTRLGAYIMQQEKIPEMFGLTTS